MPKTMTVKELKEALEGMDDDMKIVHSDTFIAEISEGKYVSVDPIEKVVVSDVLVVGNNNVYPYWLQKSRGNEFHDPTQPDGILDDMKLVKVLVLSSHNK